MKNSTDHKLNSRLANRFEQMIEQGLEEGNYQKFLEEHPEFLPLPFLLNHQLHFGLIISQFRLNTSLTADFCYLTKSSYRWNIVLVELERPDIPLFTQNKKQLTPSAEFTSRRSQVDTWMDSVQEAKEEVLAQLAVLRQPLAQNDVRFKYVLIIGRGGSEPRPDIARRLSLYEARDLRIMTFDSLLRHYRGGFGTTSCIISLSKKKIQFKHLHAMPGNLLDYVRPNDILLTEANKRRLRGWSFSVKDWEAGSRVAVNKRIAKFLGRR
jgi:Shedu protein SduA, C-terminal